MDTSGLRSSTTWPRFIYQWSRSKIKLMTAPRIMYIQTNLLTYLLTVITLLMNNSSCLKRSYEVQRPKISIATIFYMNLKFNQFIMHYLTYWEIDQLRYKAVFSQISKEIFKQIWFYIPSLSWMSTN